MCAILGEEFCTCIPADTSEIFNNTKSIWEVNTEQLFKFFKKKKDFSLEGCHEYT